MTTPMPPVKPCRQADQILVPRSLIEGLALQEGCLVRIDDDHYHINGWACHFCSEHVKHWDDPMVHDHDCTVMIARKLLGEQV